MRFFFLLQTVFLLSSSSWANISRDSMVFWYREDALSALMDGDKVSVWPDKSPNQLNAVQTEFLYQPVIKKRAVLGKSAISFNGYSHFLKTAKNVWTLGEGSFEVILAGRPQLGSVFYQGILAAGKTGLSPQLGIFQKSLVISDFTGSNLYTTPTQAPYLSPGEVAVLRFRREGGKLSTYLNTKLSGESDLTISTEIDEPLVIGGHPLSKEFFWGDLFEIVLYSRALNADEAREFQCYLVRKYGLIVPTCESNRP